MNDLKYVIMLLGVLGLVFPIANAQEFPEYGVKVETIVENLTVPWSIVFTLDERIFVTERIGQLRVIQEGVLVEEPVLSLDVGSEEGGLLGIALHPNFEENHYIYLYYTYNDFISTKNKLVRYTESENKLSEEIILLDEIPGGPYHDGGRIKFGPDNLLYITVGDAGDASLSQNLSSNAGKILRINHDGSIPEDNPISDSPIFTWGHRNPQGIDWDPISGMLVASEHGPSGWRGVAHDEINVIIAGKNYGWPDIIGNESKEGLEVPFYHTGDDTWAPSGVAFYDSDNIEEWENKFFVATLRGNHLHMLDLNLEENKVVSNEKLFEGEFGRLRDVVTGPDGHLYVLTSNKDDRGSPETNDDRILRIVPLVDDKEILSPKKQIQNGIDKTEVKCKSYMTLIFKINGQPSCIKNSSVDKLLERGFFLSIP